MIEVLIAVLVLSVGLLGMAGLQAVSLQMNHGAYVRSQAANLAYEITDSMRANRSAAADYNGTHSTTACITNFTPSSGTVAAKDVAEWRNRLACLLPGGNGTIAFSSTTTAQATITVRWDESRYGGTSAEALSFTTEL